MKIYAIHDNKSKTFNTPFFQHTDTHALRAFKAEVNRQHDQNMIYLYPEEFDLFLLGTFNEDDGIIESELTKLTNGTALKNGER
jgi:predicted RecB family nuclease